MSEILEKTHPELVKAFRKAGLARVFVNDTPLGNLSVWDGYIRHPHVALQRFDVQEGDYPHGCYATFWAMTRGDKGSKNAMVGFGIFPSDHNAGLPMKMRQNMRVNGLIARAKEEFATAEKIRREERHGVSG